MAKKKAKKPKPLNDGRDRKGKFGKGNHCATGRNDTEAAQRSNKLKAALLSAVTAKDMQAIAGELVKKAKTGDVPACKELFDRCLGKPHQTHEVEGELAFRLILGKPKT